MPVVKSKSNPTRNSNNKTKKRGQLFSNNNPATTVHGYGFDTPAHVTQTLTDLNNRDIIYQFQVVNTLNERAKAVLKRTPDPVKKKNISSSIVLLSKWLSSYRKQDRGTKENYPYLPVQVVNKLELLAEYYNISRKARGLEKPTLSDEGFLPVYRRVKNNIAKLRTLPVKSTVPSGDTWDKHRNNYIKRRLLMLKSAGYGLYHMSGPLVGLPTILHVNMLMWAYTPDAGLLKSSQLTQIVKKIKLLKK
jgi:hypothetical protein